MATIFDIELYPNYALVVFASENQVPQYWEMFEGVRSGSLIIPDDTLVGFNSKNYDMLILSAMKAGWSNAQLKQLNDDIIVNKAIKWWQFERSTGIPLIDQDHIDIIEVLPGMASLKIYGGRIGSQRLQDLPYEPDRILTRGEADEVRHYCGNDCLVTRELYNKVEQQIELRGRLGDAYGMDLRSKSDAQIAEAVITGEVERRTGNRIYKPSSSEWLGRVIKYTAPSFVGFNTPTLQSLLQEVQEISFEIGSNGSPKIPKALSDRVIQIGPRGYRMGIGGLHSVDGPGSFYASESVVLADIDVASYYPSIILNAGYYPTHIGPVFLDIYRDLVNRRLDAKHRGDKVTADTLKITINGTFGKLGSKWSKVYAPDLMLHVTLTGQLCLMMLIEALPDEVISANTDGIMVWFDKWSESYIRSVVKHWEKFTGFVMEWSFYKWYARRDCNNYVAEYLDE